ncbi:hypothetical protein FBY31_4403 [Arthrobacter sp. SLBN-100]|uniref:hypothetical protein n=1 Tax=Arthrobacter sp. SLBN-100 TaxID=2768450 RepID=UPI001153174B|nr:hypothetical protein [Arthrobacter sp. SLBN-100]TQJ62027.1 hypothetical protein FBY31_4403 [Arthrobacter sp. SLBN-100]
MTPFIKTGLKVAGAVGALVLTFGIGAQSTSAKTVEIEKVVEKPVDRVVTKTVEKEVTPQTCLDFIRLADEAFGYASDAEGYGREAIQAAGKRDTAGLQAYIDRMDILTPKLTALVGPINTNRIACKLGVK